MNIFQQYNTECYCTFQVFNVRYSEMHKVQGAKCAISKLMYGLSVCTDDNHSLKLVAYRLVHTDQGQLLEGVECHIYLYCFTLDDINLNRALVIIVLFPTKYSNKKVCANDIGK